jgi:HAD superfamily hydrolase (TIGR01509 family)
VSRHHIIFDCDGVLVDSEWLSCEVESELLADYGVTISPQQLASRYIGSTITQMFVDIEAKHDLALPPDFLPRYHRRIASAFADRLSAVPAIIDVMAAISTNRSVASNSDLARVQHSLAVTGLSGFFDAARVFSAEMVETPKPAPDLHRHILAVTGASADGTIVIEDSVSGVTAARSAGLRAIGYVGASHCQPDLGGRLEAAGASHIFDNMQELPDLLATLT